MNMPDQCLDDINRGLRQDAVTQVENVAGSAVGLAENPVGLASHLVHGPEQNGGIEVSLDRDILAQPGPALVQLHSPIEPDDVSARGFLKFEERPGIGAEMDGGHVRGE